MTQIIKDYPPNISEIVKVFPMALRPGIIFAYDGVIYNPHDKHIPQHMIAHEEIHLARQKLVGADYWWRWYLADEDFRYDEELLAHRAEYQSLIAGACRHVRRAALGETAKRLAAPLYGRIVTVSQAKSDILSE